ncbi:MAG: EamA family transporter [Pygmaiobacter sp.]
MWFIFTLLTIVGWAGSDLFSKLGTKTTDKLSHWKMLIMVGAVMGLHAFWLLLFGNVDYDLRNLLLYLPVSALYILSMLFGYAGLRYIELSISSPICNSSGAIVSVLCFLFLGQRMNAPQLFAIILICTGVLGLGLLEKASAERERCEEGIVPERKYTHSLLAFSLPLLYCILDALGTFADAFYLGVVMDELNANISYELTFFVVGIVAFFYVVCVRKERLSFRNDRWKGVAAISETFGQFCYVFALSGNAIVAAPAIASYSLFSVLLSRIILKEKLSATHYAIIAPVMLGIAILGFFSA